ASVPERGPGHPPMTMLALFGGLALLLYGMRLAGDGLQRAAGGSLRHLLTASTRSRVAAMGSGALVTALIQSSSPTTLILVGLLRDHPHAGRFRGRGDPDLPPVARRHPGRRHRDHGHRPAPGLPRPRAGFGPGRDRLRRELLRVPGGREEPGPDDPRLRAALP